MRLKLRPDSAAFTLLLAGLAALPPLGIDMNLPALAQIGRDLHAPAAQTGLTLSLFLLGYAAAQLLFGPLSDRFGRRGPLFAGCLLFTLGALGAATAPGITALLAWRVVQGAGAGAGSVMAFAVVRDLFSGTAARVKLAYVNAVMNVAPMVGPTFGSLMLPVTGWRPIFGVQAAAGVLLVLAVLLAFVESHARPDVNALTPVRLVRNYGARARPSCRRRQQPDRLAQLRRPVRLCRRLALRVHQRAGAGATLVWRGVRRHDARLDGRRHLGRPARCAGCVRRPAAPGGALAEPAVHRMPARAGGRRPLCSAGRRAPADRQHGRLRPRHPDRSAWRAGAVSRHGRRRLRGAGMPADADGARSPARRWRGCIGTRRWR